MWQQVKCLEQHSKCYRLFPRELFRLAVRNIKRMYKSRCLTSNGRQEFLKHMKCIVSPERSEPVHQCVDKWTLMMRITLDNFSKEDYFPSSCCAFLLFKNCLIAEVDKACENTTGNETSRYITKTISSMILDKSIKDLAVKAAFNKSCEVSIEQADKCALKLMFEGDRERVVPRSLDDMEAHCRNATTKIKCIEKHAKCYSSFPRQVMGTALSNIKRAYKQRCSREGKKEFLKHTRCIKSEKQSEPAHQTLDKWTYNMKYILSSVKHEDHIPACCCAFHVFRQDLIRTVNKLCENTTKDSTAKYIEQNISAGVSDFLDLGCNRFRTIADCRKNLPNITKTIETNTRHGVPRQQTSAIFHFLQIAVTFH
ncbi:hypothetical protein B4U79_11412 [Dinothrombium tinctorium]|uniref:Uncharacterized protein n=1 Tax=Dinothrombium tinctorium TaxID=1965070 RepID=A0A443QUY4_9ACAR|nr:hypothetical protein B4U79_11412 [Dinothrombium tinctorium]